VLCQGSDEAALLDFDEVVHVLYDSTRAHYEGLFFQGGCANAVAKASIVSGLIDSFSFHPSLH
jgi:hypothetical protein